MKIITWNCNGKFSEEIFNENADIYVIQECENPEITKSDEFRKFAENGFWIGDNEHRGLGVFAKEDIKLELQDLDNAGLRYFIPVRVNDTFNLLGVWTNPNTKNTDTQKYPDEILKYHELHGKSGFFDEDIIICGDFNCDARLKRMHAKKVYMVVETLEKHNLVDTYHYLNDEAQGEETKATFFMYRHLDKPFHLDHVFASPGRIEKLTIGDEEYWTQFSDHLPIIFEID